MSFVSQPMPDLTVSLVADVHCAYVSERVTFCVRVQAWTTVQHLRVGIALPAVFNITCTDVLDAQPERNQLSDDSVEVVWTLAQPLLAEQKIDLHVQAEVRQAYAPAFREFLKAQGTALDRERALPVRAEAWAQDAAQDAARKVAADQDSTVVAIRIMSRHASYLPSLYRQEDNDLLGRFLMGGERLWQPLERWLDHIEILADPLLAPEHVLAWLGGWANEPEDERWPTARRRLLLREAMRLRCWRGTRQALSDHIALYTGVAPSITEHRASQLQVGKDARLGLGVVLGSGQTPHTFSVAASLQQDATPLEKHQRVIRDIIEAEKPAHTQLKDLTVSWVSA